MSKKEKTEEMFCYQCEQRAGCSGCTGARGVCGKSSKTALLQDKLTGSLVALAEAVGEHFFCFFYFAHLLFSFSCFTYFFKFLVSMVRIYYN